MAAATTTTIAVTYRNALLLSMANLTFYRLVSLVTMEQHRHVITAATARLSPNAWLPSLYIASSETTSSEFLMPTLEHDDDEQDEDISEESNPDPERVTVPTVAKQQYFNVTRNKANWKRFQYDFPRPVFVLSLPKSGTTSTMNFFRCGGVPAAHHFTINATNHLDKIGNCFGPNVQRQLPILHHCNHAKEKFEVWTDAGTPDAGKCFYPSLSAGSLENIAKFYPYATIMLVVRDANAWYDSASTWGDLFQRWQAHCHGLFPEARAPRQTWLDWYHAHNARVREFATNTPNTHFTYIEVPLDSNETGTVLSQRTGIPERCWTKMLPNGGRRVNGNGNNANIGTKLPSGQRPKQSAAMQVPKPVFVLSLPKSGTVSTMKFFRCGGVSAAHHYTVNATGDLDKLGNCLGANVQQNKPMLKYCNHPRNNFKVWTDLGSPDAGQCFYPTLSPGGLENIAKYYPTATLILVKRNANDWYDSASTWTDLMLRWQTRCNGIFPNANAPRETWIEWYHAHSARVRHFATHTPHTNFTYIEVQLESNATGNILAARTGLPQSCWGETMRPNGGNRHRAMMPTTGGGGGQQQRQKQQQQPQSWLQRLQELQ